MSKTDGSRYPLWLRQAVRRHSRKGRPFDPPGYWYADYALRVPAPGDYRKRIADPCLAFQGKYLFLPASGRREQVRLFLVRNQPAGLLGPLGVPCTPAIRRRGSLLCRELAVC